MKWKRNVKDINGEVLCGEQSTLSIDLGFILTSLVSQFTLLASTKKGTKPDFHGAMNSEMARDLYQRFVSKVKEGYQAEKVKDGVFQAMMQVELINDGPVRWFYPFPAAQHVVLQNIQVTFEMCSK
jgi:D-tyrosyl-tRNA(Tyr) deacylase